MIPTLDARERRLIDAYEGQAHRYDRALAIIGKAHLDAAAGERGEAWIQNLHAVLAEIAVGDAGLADDQAAWRQSGRSPGVEMRSVLDHLAKQIRTLAEQVDAQLAEILARRQRLVPEVDAVARQRQMVGAYRAADNAR